MVSSTPTELLERMGGLAWGGPSGSVQWLTTTTSTLATGCTTHMDRCVISNLQNEGKQKRTSTLTVPHPSGRSQSKTPAPLAPLFSCWDVCPRGRSRSKDLVGPDLSLPQWAWGGGVVGAAEELCQAGVMWSVSVDNLEILCNIKIKSHYSSLGVK